MFCCTMIKTGECSVLDAKDISKVFPHRIKITAFHSTGKLTLAAKTTTYHFCFIPLIHYSPHSETTTTLYSQAKTNVLWREISALTATQTV